jgi:hypothetical protein
MANRHPARQWAAAEERERIVRVVDDGAHVIMARRSRKEVACRIIDCSRGKSDVLVDLHLLCMVILQLRRDFVFHVGATVTSMDPASLARALNGSGRPDVSSVLAVAMWCVEDLLANRKVCEVRTRGHLDIVVNDDRLVGRAFLIVFT